MSPTGETGTSSTLLRASVPARIQWDIEQAKRCKVDAMLQALLQRASCSPETKQPELLQKCLEAVLPACNGQVSTGGIYSSGVETVLEK
ncbi:hypothetical protein BDR04DRAFT_1109127 [Suillus decipiens]|nr:hypothetical protein BDR04DRAFT_1109127 [Suillus decipiens]